MLTFSTLVGSASWFSLSLVIDDQSWLYYLTDPFQTGALLDCLLWAMTRGKEYMPVPVDPCPNRGRRSSIRHFLNHPSYLKISSRKSSCMAVLSPMPVAVKFQCSEWLHQVITAPYRTISKFYLFTIGLPNITLHCISDMCGYMQNWERHSSLLNIRNFWFTLCPLVLLKLGSIFSKPHEKTLWNCWVQMMSEMENAVSKGSSNMQASVIITSLVCHSWNEKQKGYVPSVKIN